MGGLDHGRAPRPSATRGWRRSSRPDMPSAMHQPLELPIVECRGRPRELGRAQGEAFAKQIQAFVEQRLEAFQAYAAERNQPAAFEHFIAAGARCLEAQRHWHEAGYEEHL